MNRLLPAAWSALTAALVSGCAATDRNLAATGAPPALGELPRFEYLERRSGATIAIDDPSGRLTRVRVVPEFREVKPTPQEQKILGPQEPRRDEFALLYPPPPTPERGIDPMATGLKTGTYGRGGPEAGVYRELSAFATSGWAGPDAGVYPLAARMAGVYGPREPAAGMGGREEVVTGVDRKRTVAGRHSRLNE